MLKLSKILKLLRDEWIALAVTTIGTIIYVLAVVYFTIPYQFPDLGVSGLAVLSHYAFGISPAWVIFFGNLALFVWGWKALSPRFILLSSYSVILSSVLIPLFLLYPVDLPHDRFLATVISGVIKGASIALLLKVGSSSGGTDIIAVAVNKRHGIDVGVFSIVIDLVIFALSLGIVGLHATIYGVVGLYVFGVILDSTTHSFDRRKQAIIITNIPHEVSTYIHDTFGRGTTRLQGEGGFTGQPRPVLIALLGQKQVAELKLYLQKNDQNAFVSICDAAEVLGEGFKSWKSL